MPENDGVSRREGCIDVPGGRIWYESMGTSPRKLLLLHGGPGGNCEDLRPLMELAAADFHVVRFDQLGSWRSDQPDDTSLWNVPRFVAEVESVRQALDWERMHLLGQSWGAILALEYALHHQDRLHSLVLASGGASVPEIVAGMNLWREALPAETQATMTDHEARATYDHPDYLAAVEVLYRRHLCRTWPFPEALSTAMAHIAMPVYGSMWGPNEFTCTGSLRDWDRTERLGEIEVPTLITVGEFDEVHPSCAETMQRGIRGSRLVQFAQASHTVHVEQPMAYWAEVQRFLLNVDPGECA